MSEGPVTYGTEPRTCVVCGFRGYRTYHLKDAWYCDEHFRTALHPPPPALAEGAREFVAIDRDLYEHLLDLCHIHDYPGTAISLKDAAAADHLVLDRAKDRETIAGYLHTRDQVMADMGPDEDFSYFDDADDLIAALEGGEDDEQSWVDDFEEGRMAT